MSNACHIPKQLHHDVMVHAAFMLDQRDHVEWNSNRFSVFILQTYFFDRVCFKFHTEISLIPFCHILDIFRLNPLKLWNISNSSDKSELLLHPPIKIAARWGGCSPPARFLTVCAFIAQTCLYCYEYPYCPVKTGSIALGF